MYQEGHLGVYLRQLGGGDCTWFARFEMFSRLNVPASYNCIRVKGLTQQSEASDSAWQEALTHLTRLQTTRLPKDV